MTEAIKTLEKLFQEVRTKGIPTRRALEEFCKLHSGTLTIPERPYSKAFDIVQRFRAGYKAEEIAQMLKTNPTYTKRVIKKFMETKKIPD